MSEEIKKAKAVKLVEVELLRKYALAADTAEIKSPLPAGTIVSLPGEEASRAVKLGIATVTAHSFE